MLTRCFAAGLCLGLGAPLLKVAPVLAQVSHTNDAPLLAPPRAWRVAPRPLVQADAIELNRVVGLVSLADGRIVVANDPSELLFLSPDGTLISRSGRQGEGPGEFEHLSGLGVLGSNHLWAIDQPRGILSIWTTTGQFARTIPLRQLIPVSGMAPRGQLADGRLVLYSAAIVLNVPLPGGVDSTDVIAISPETRRFSTLARIPRTDLGNPTGSKVFGAPTLVVAGHNVVYWGHGTQFLIHRIGADGSRVGEIRKPGPLPRLTDGMWRSYLDHRLSRVRATGSAGDSQRQRLRRDLEGMARPEVLPALGAMLLDHEGNLWVRDYFIPELPSGRWHVFNANGRWVTSLSLPDRFTPWEISVRGILGVQRDEVDVETVVLLRLEKPD